jgi:hypothetical protein
MAPCSYLFWLWVMKSDILSLHAQSASKLAEECRLSGKSGKKQAMSR